MGNQLQHVGLKLDKAHRASSVGCNDLTGSSDLEGGRRVKSDARINERISSFKNFKRDVLEAAAFSAVAADIVGFRLEFEVIGGSTVLWSMPRMTYVKVTQVFEHANAPPRLTSVRGFYILYFMFKDLWDSESFAKEMAKADGDSAADARACASIKSLRDDVHAAVEAQTAAQAQATGASSASSPTASGPMPLAESEGRSPTSEEARGSSASASAGRSCDAENTAALDNVKIALLSEDDESDETRTKADMQESAAKVLPCAVSALEVDEHECPICMDARIVVAPPCGHGLCRGCYEEWRQHSDVCPTCRGDGTGSELWVDLFQTKIPDGSEHVDDLMQAIHTYVQMLPRLETRWEKQQRILRQRAMRSRSSTLSTAASSSSLNSDAATATAEASLQRMLAEAEVSAPDEIDDASMRRRRRRRRRRHDAASGGSSGSFDDDEHAWLATVNENTLRRVDVSQLDEELQIEVAMRLSLAAAS